MHNEDSYYYSAQQRGAGGAKERGKFSSSYTTSIVV